MNSTRRTTTRLTAMLGLVAAATACDSTTVGDPDAIAVAFRVTTPGSAPATAPAGPARVAGPPMAISGTNGALTIDEIRIIINEVELKPADGSCDSRDRSGPGSDDCPEFEAPPRFLDLPLDGQPIAAVTALIPPGSYKELDFEIEDLEDDEEDAAQRAAIDAVRTQILAEISDWPRKASAMVVGSFTPTGGEPVSFRVFLDAEVEIEMELLPRLEIGVDGSANRSLTVDVQPEAWFARPDGTVLPLHLYDFDLTNELLEFEVEMEHGFTEIEIG